MNDIHIYIHMINSHIQHKLSYAIDCYCRCLLPEPVNPLVDSEMTRQARAYLIGAAKELLS
jgi:hypothetical protein